LKKKIWVFGEEDKLKKMVKMKKKKKKIWKSLEIVVSEAEADEEDGGW
jgi:hypothetical protein